MSNETPTMPDTAFNLGINYIKLDVIIKLMAEIIKNPLINEEDFSAAFLYLRTLHKEHSDAFDVIVEEESKKPILNEETMGDDHADEEGDAQQEKPIDFEDVR